MNQQIPERLIPNADPPSERNIPYRGIVDHGVPTGRMELEDEEHYWTGRPVEYEPENPEDLKPPVPVRIVTSGAREIRQFAVNAYEIVAGQVVQAANRDDRRTRLTIKCLAGAINVGGMNVSNLFGYTLVAGAEITLASTEPVWVAHQNGDTAVWQTLIEYTERVG